MPPATPKGNKFMRIIKLEYTAPTQANQIGNVTFEVEVPIIYKEGVTAAIKESDEIQIDLSPETQKLLQQTAEEIIKDITRIK
jgi:hypothetical protein